jgi:hypothetical protein
MSFNIAQKLIKAHLVSGSLVPGEAIALHIDQTLTQDAKARSPCCHSRQWTSIA